MSRRLAPAIAALLAGGGVFTLLRWLRLRRDATTTADDEDEEFSLVDEASIESFPASDPPSWTLGEDRWPDQSSPSIRR